MEHICQTFYNITSSFRLFYILFQVSAVIAVLWICIHFASASVMDHVHCLLKFHRFAVQ